MQRPFELFAISLGESVYQLWDDTLEVIRFTGEIVSLGCRVIIHPKELRKKETLYYLETCGPNAIPISVLICMLMGLIVGYQSAVQMHKYGADSFLPALVGCSIVREMGPLMVAIIATGRVGSAFAAEIATMKSTEEINAMLTMGLSPWRFLVLPKLVAMVVAMPILTLLGDFAGIAGGMLVGVLDLQIPLETYYASTLSWVAGKFYIESIIKSIVFSVIITTIACMRGFNAKADSLGIGRATTSSVVTSIVLVILSDAMLAKMFNIIFYGD